MTKKLSRDVQIIAERIIKKYHPEKIILFGSAARDEFEEGSDLDFFIIKQTKLPRHRRAIEIFYLLRDLDREYPADFIIYTPKEFKVRLALGDFFVKNILEEGEVLYEAK
ncbi:MAG: nucleotidyltransferase domain-containing protein [Candidatus Omnitrophica bacterium]|nr:nucleotidyltransferase domain-containing protein [Candidatus Omnitrophota bacterium]